MQKKWQIRQTIKSKTLFKRQTEIVKKILANRGLKTSKEQKDFFNPQNPKDIKLEKTGIEKKELQKAIKRIKKAVVDKELIVIYGDYDADGVTSTAIVWETLHACGAETMPFIPHREAHGYGIKKQGLDNLIKDYGKPGLIITVDNGIVAFSGAKYCQDLGIDLIICDHHQKKKVGGKSKKNQKLKTELPEALAVIHSHKIAGAGVAWFFAREIGLAMGLKKTFCDQNLELAAIGTITDLLPLIGINRSLVKFGLKKIAVTKRPGIKALLVHAEVKPMQVEAYHIGFIVGPRLNAMGRLEHALDALRLLCTKDDQRAMRLAVDLGMTNKTRQDLTMSAFLKADEMIDQNKVWQKKLLFVTDKDFNHGIIGLVAGKLAEKYWRPTIVVTKGSQYSKGSVRSIKGVNIINILREIEADFVDLGGHPGAAGFTIETKKIVRVKKKLTKIAQEKIADQLLTPVLQVDCLIKLKDINIDLFKQITKLAPFGFGNKKPVLAVKKVKIINCQPVGREGKHLKLIIGNEKSAQNIKLSSNYLEAIFFNGAKNIASLDLQKPVDLAFQIDENNWNGQKSLQLLVKDVSQCIVQV